MKDAFNNAMVFLRRIRWLLILLFFSALLFFLLPGALQWTANRLILPRVLSDLEIPVTGGSVRALDYHKLVAGGFSMDAGSGVLINLSELEAVYSPSSLTKGRIDSVSGRITSGPDIQMEAEFAARDIHLSSESIAATVTARCSRVSVEGLSIGPVELGIQIDGTDAAFDFDVPLQDGLLTAHVTANADWSTNPVWNCSVELPLIAEDGSAVQLGEMIPEFDDLSVSGMVAADISGDESGGEAVVSVTVSRLEMPEQSLVLDNLITSCTMRFPGEPRSLPDQLLTVDRLSVGELMLEQIQMHYQVEPESVFYIEDLEANWCEGRISLYDTRVQPMTTNVATQLFCDRLSLEQVLASCGLSGFSAGGELNGRLPILWKDGEVTIDDGFLFTTPGRGGTFAFGAAEAAAGILPPGSLEAGQIGLVTAALAEFNYDWITMTLNSEGENLLVKVGIAGQPVNILPYEYDPKRGTYVKVALRPGRGLRQPMQFELNLTVPLNQLLCYASGINRQWNLFQGK